MTCTAARNGASCAAYRPARLSITPARNSAACTALRDSTIMIAAITDSGPSTQKVIASPVDVAASTTSGLTARPCRRARRTR